VAVANGVKYTDLKQPILTDRYDEWAAQILCYVLGVSPMSFLFQNSTKATSQTAQEQSQEEGRAPVIEWVGDFLTLAVRSGWGWTDIKCRHVDPDEPDPALEATNHKTYFDIGVKSVNEIRLEIGLPPSGPGGDEHFIVAGNQLIPLDQAAQMAEEAHQAAIAPKPAPVIAGPNGKAPPQAGAANSPPPPAAAAKGPKAGPPASNGKTKAAKKYAGADFVKVGDFLVPTNVL